MKSQRGFTLIEGLLILVVVILLGGIGWYVYQAKDKTDSSYANADSANSSVADYSKNENKAKSSTKKIDEKFFSLELPSGWEKSANNSDTGIDGVSRFKYENKRSGEFFQVDIDQTQRGALYGDYNWSYIADKANSGAIKLKGYPDENTQCTEDNQPPDTCPEDDKQFTVYILPDEGLPVNNHVYHFLAGNTMNQDGQSTKLYKEILMSFKAK